MDCVERHSYGKLFETVPPILDVEQSRVVEYGEAPIIGGVTRCRKP